jgi:hypothetical protein
MAAHAVYGNGRIFWVGDSSPPDDGSASPGNTVFDGWGEASGRDSLLFLNATMWVTRRCTGITSFSPPYGDYGSTVTITGTHLELTTEVRFNGVLASFTIQSPMSVAATVPAGATAGPLVIVGACGTNTSDAFFYPPTWPTCGVAAQRGIGNQQSPVAMPDGAGGAFVVWQDDRGTGVDLYAQRMNGNGQPLWPEAGVAVCTADGAQTNPVLISDGAGGMLVAWQDSRAGNFDVYVARVNGGGTLVWTSLAAFSSGDEMTPSMASDGAGGAIIAWQDHRSGGWRLVPRLRQPPESRRSSVLEYGRGPDRQYSSESIPARGDGRWILRRLHRVGRRWEPARRGAAHPVQWLAHLAVPGHRRGEPDGGRQRVAGRARPRWKRRRDRDHGGGDIVAQRLNASGQAQWTAPDVVVCAAAGAQNAPAVTVDGAGGAVVAWVDARVSSGDIYSQRVNASGSPQWTSQGVLVCDAAGQQLGPPHRGPWRRRSHRRLAGPARRIERRLCPAFERGRCHRVDDERHRGLRRRIGSVESDDGARRVGRRPRRLAGQPERVELRRADDARAIRRLDNGRAVESGRRGANLSRSHPIHSATRFASAFTLAAEKWLRMEVFDVMGRRVRIAPNARFSAGPHVIEWDGRADGGARLRGGIFFVRLHGPGFDSVQPVVHFE